MKTRLVLPILRIVLVAIVAAGAAFWCIRTAEGPPLEIEPQLLGGHPDGASGATGGGKDAFQARGVGSRVCPPSRPWWHGTALPSTVHRECFPEWGLEIAWVKDEGPVVVSNVLSYFPAERAGIRPGDSLFSVNGMLARGKNPRELLGAMSPVLRVNDTHWIAPQAARLTFARDELRVRATLPFLVNTLLAGH